MGWKSLRDRPLVEVSDITDTAEASEHWGGEGGGGEGLTDISSGYEVMLLLKISKIKFLSFIKTTLVSFIMSIDGKCKTS